VVAGQVRQRLGGFETEVFDDAGSHGVNSRLEQVFEEEAR
jgi:hypothetical protein